MCRAWATVVPSWLMLLVLVTYASYLGLMAYSTPSMDSLSLLVGTSSLPPEARALRLIRGSVGRSEVGDPVRGRRGGG